MTLESTTTMATERPREEAEQHSFRILAILSALMAFASISTDLYLPAMPIMGAALNADNGLIELTISGYLAGFSIGQLFWGPLGDRYGRKMPVATGLVLFVIGSAGCATSETATMLIGWRAVQAVGACASVVLARAMIRDLFAGPRAAQMMSTLMTVMAIAPLVGPTIGGQILHVSTWRAIFWTLVLAGIGTLVALRWLPESLPTARRNRQPMCRALPAYGALLKDRRLLAYAGAGGFFYGAVYAYIAGTPFAYISYYHVPPQWYGVLFAAGIVGIMATNTLNARLVVRYGGDALMRFGTATAAVSGVVLAVTASTGFGGLAGIALPLFLVVSTNGFIVANSIAGALGLFPERAGAASALVGAIQYGLGIAGSALVGGFADGTPWPMGCVIAVFCVAGLACASSAPSHPRPHRPRSSS